MSAAAASAGISGGINGEIPQPAAAAKANGGVIGGKYLAA